MTLKSFLLTLKGGAGSGNFGHGGRPGKRGGSSSTSGIPNEALEGVNLTKNYDDKVSSAYQSAKQKLEEWHSYGLSQGISLKDIPKNPSDEDLNWAKDLDLYHRSHSSEVRYEGLKPSSETGVSVGSRYYDEPLGRTKAVFLSMGSLQGGLDYGKNVVSIKADKILNRPNTLVGKDVGTYPAEGMGPGINAYKKDLLKGSDALRLIAYERTIDRWINTNIHNRPNDRPFVPSLGGEVMYFGSLSPDELTFR